MTEVTKIFRRTTYPAISPTRPSNTQEGRTVLIAGASEGIALNIAHAYALANAQTIILVSRSPTKLDAAAQSVRACNATPNVETRVCDLSQLSQLHALWTSLQTSGIFIDVLVASAAATLPPPDLPAAEAMIHFNMTAALHLFTHFQQQAGAAAASRQKFYVYISSATFHCYPYPASIMYGATKAGWTNYLCHVADTIPESSMRIIALHPGAVYTSAVVASGEVPRDLPIWDDVSLAAGMGVWAAGAEAGFLHGRFVWANWDVEELMEREEEVRGDAGLWRVGVTGVGSFGVGMLMEVGKRFPVGEGGGG